MRSIRRSLVGFCVLFALLVSGRLAADDSAPFGLTWGMTAEDLKSLGVALAPQEHVNNMVVYKAETLPKNISDAEFYLVLFDESTGLQKVMMSSKDITNDLYGSAGKERFKVLKETFSSKYGAPINSFEFVGRELFQDDDEFYECLKYEGCGIWLADWKSAGSSYLLELKGSRRGTGYIRITVEGPGWSAVLSKKSSLDRSNDAEAL